MFDLVNINDFVVCDVVCTSSTNKCVSVIWLFLTLYWPDHSTSSSLHALCFQRRTEVLNWLKAATSASVWFSWLSEDHLQQNDLTPCLYHQEFLIQFEFKLNENTFATVCLHSSSVCSLCMKYFVCARTNYWNHGLNILELTYWFASDSFLINKMSDFIPFNLSKKFALVHLILFLMQFLLLNLFWTSSIYFCE